MLTVEPDDLGRADTRALLALHVADMRDGVPIENSFALEAEELASPTIRFFAVRDAGCTIAIGALSLLPDGTGEIKSMRTHPDHLRKGAAARLLDRLIAEARQCGLRRLSLETGTSEAFGPALALYRSRGFEAGPAFADYPPDTPYNQYMHLDLVGG